MSKGGNQVEETPQQRALAAYATQQWGDYKRRWLPLQQNLAAQVEDMSKADSSVRERAAGRVSTDTAAKFDQANNALDKTLADNVGLGSSRAKLGATGLADDEAKSKGLGLTVADQQVNDAYTQSLGALAAAGRGERQAVGSSLAQQADISGRQAESDAQIAYQERAGNAKVGGQLAGFGIQQSMGKFGSAPPSTVNSGANVTTPGAPGGVASGYIVPQF